MKKLKLYIDTSVLGGLFDIEDTKRVDTAERLFQLIKDGVYEGYISRLTVRRLINNTNLKMGYNPIEIISPEEVTGDGEMEV